MSIGLEAGLCLAPVLVFARLLLLEVALVAIDRGVALPHESPTQFQGRSAFLLAQYCGIGYDRVGHLDRHLRPIAQDILIKVEILNHNTK